MSGIFVFLGPTLALEDAQRRLSATYLPPVEQGDVARLLARNPRAIAIIDGRFQFLPSVWHKEILAALGRGVHVFGAASMGALRAAELWPFGMIGVGKVFEAYRNGKIQDDDEVAISHGDANLGYRETSDAMVNIRDAVSAALEAKLIAVRDAEAFLTIAKGIYFPERTWAQLFEIAGEQGVCPKSIAEMNRFRRTHPPVKKRDALELLDRLAEFSKSAPEPFRANFTLEHTVFLDNLLAESEFNGCFERGVRTGSETIEVSRKKILLEMLSLQEARRQGISVTDADVAEMRDWFTSRYDLQGTNLDSWMADEGLSSETLSDAMRRFVAVNKVEEFHRPALDRILTGHLRVTSARDRQQAGWLQINVELVRARIDGVTMSGTNGQDVAAVARTNARELFARLSATVHTARMEGSLEKFFFVRKPPDARLRFYGKLSRLRPMLNETLETARLDHLITRQFESVYEPEAGLFGGFGAMDLVHDFCDADTRVWLRTENYSPAYSLRLLHELFFVTLGCWNESWQTWDLLADLTAPDTATPACGPHPDDINSIQLEQAHVLAIQALSRGLNTLWETGQLRAGMRNILASVAMFHFNRYGVPGNEQAVLARHMVTQNR